MKESIQKFNEQFGYEPKIEKEDKFVRKNKFIIAGMGGSNLASDFLWIYRPEIQVITHRDYGLPVVGDIDSHTVIASSYSGNTEETISAFQEALDRKLPLAVIAKGGRLLDLAKEHGISYIQLPDSGIQARIAVGLSFIAMLKLLGDGGGIEETKKLKDGLNPDAYESLGKELAEKIKGRIPVVYSSTANGPLARYWKIVLNESGKTPAFYNVFPELNHNEMAGVGSVKELADKFCFIFLNDSLDSEKIKKRMEITRKLFEDKGMAVEGIELENGQGIIYRIFSSAILASWTAYYTAQNYGLDAEGVSMIEEFKKAIT